MSAILVASAGYDSETETLEVEFQNGAIYQYFNVPENLFKQLMREQGKGEVSKHSYQECLPLFSYWLSLTFLIEFVEKFNCPYIIELFCINA